MTIAILSFFVFLITSVVYPWLGNMHHIRVCLFAVFLGSLLNSFLFLAACKFFG